MKLIVAYCGSKATDEAKQTRILVGKFMNQAEVDKKFQNSLNNFLSQSQTRDLNLQNVFFRINWNILVAVSKF
jgi:hypothetical protein